MGIIMTSSGIQWHGMSWNKWKILTENPLSINLAFMKLNILNACFTLVKSIMKSIYLVFTIIGWVDFRWKPGAHFLCSFMFLYRSRHNSSVEHGKILGGRQRKRKPFLPITQITATQNEEWKELFCFSNKETPFNPFLTECHPYFPCNTVWFIYIAVDFVSIDATGPTSFTMEITQYNIPKMIHICRENIFPSRWGMVSHL